MSIKKIPFISYTLAAVAGICFISGLAIISNEGGLQNEPVGNVINNA